MYVVRMVREAVPSMRERGGGSILNITAISAIQPIRGFSLSVATWSGVIGSRRRCRSKWRNTASTVNTICPGYIDTSACRRCSLQVTSRRKWCRRGCVRRYR